MNTIKRGSGERGGAWQIVLGILGGLVLLCVVAVLVAIWAVNRYVQIEVKHNGDSKRVEVRTPIGEFTVEKGEEAGRRLKLPVYPGAEPEEESVSVRLWGRVEDEEGGLHVTAAEFRTRDSLDEVDAWYREQLGSEFIREKGRIVGGDHRGQDGDWEIRVEPGGDDVLYKHEREGRLRGVVLSQELGRVKIGLFELAEARPQ